MHLWLKTYFVIENHKNLNNAKWKLVIWINVLMLLKHIFSQENYRRISVTVEIYKRKLEVNRITRFIAHSWLKESYMEKLFFEMYSLSLLCFFLILRNDCNFVLFQFFQNSFFKNLYEYIHNLYLEYHTQTHAHTHTHTYTYIYKYTE